MGSAYVSHYYCPHNDKVGSVILGVGGWGEGILMGKQDAVTRPRIFESPWIGNFILVSRSQTKKWRTLLSHTLQRFPYVLLLIFLDIFDIY